MFSWFRKRKKLLNAMATAPPPAPSPQLPVSNKPSIEAVVAAVDPVTDEPEEAPGAFWNSAGSVEHWASQMYQDEVKKGTFEHLAGKGKPMDVPDGDIANSILKNANVLPDWLTLQHEIRDQLHSLITAANPDPKRVERELDDINRKIKKYNTLVPSIVLQKRKLTPEDMHKQYSIWA